MAQSTVKVPCLGGEMLIEKWRYVQIDDNKLDMVKKRYKIISICSYIYLYIYINYIYIYHGAQNVWYICL